MVVALSKEQAEGCEEQLLLDTSLRLSTIFSTCGPSDFRLALERRERVLGAATLAAESLVLLHNLLQPLIGKLGMHLIWHEATITAAEKQEILPRHVAVQKTITVLFHTIPVLVTGIGDFQFFNQHLNTIGRHLPLSSKERRHATINPRHIEPHVKYGMMEGMVSPFLSRYHASALTVLAYMTPPPESGEERNTVAISLSRYESLLIPQSLLFELLVSYADVAYPHIRLIHLNF